MQTGDLIALGVLVIGGGGLAGAAGSLLRPLFRREVIRVDAAKTAIEASVQIVNELQEELTRARTQLDKVTDRAERASTAARHATRAMNLATDRLEQVIGWIHDPYMTIEQLRVRAPAGPGSNGIAGHLPGSQ
jgi:exonuclease VII small subunit